MEFDKPVLFKGITGKAASAPVRPGENLESVPVAQRQLADLLPPPNSVGSLPADLEVPMNGTREANILYENGPFYAYQTGKGIEIRKSAGSTHSTLVGEVSDPAVAQRFIDRAARYPEKF